VQHDVAARGRIVEDASLKNHALDATMKRAVLTLPVLALACGAAVAQGTPPTVTVYGIVDAGINYVTGMASNKTQLVSGIMEGSRFGLRGNEDLGGGYRALFTVEHRMEINDGTFSTRPLSGLQTPDRLNQASLLDLPASLQPAVSAVAAGIAQRSLGVNVDSNPARFWDRQAYVGLVTPFGAILLGRQYTPAYEVAATFDTLGTQSSLTLGQVISVPAGIDIRVSNAIQYRIVLGGLTAGAMYSLGDPGVVTGNDKASRFGGAMVMYKAGPYAAGIGYNQRNNDIGQESLRSTMVGASAQIGPGTVSAVYSDIKDDNPSGVSTIATSLTPLTGATAAALVQAAFTEGVKQDGSLVHIGYKWPMGNNTLYVAYSSYDDKRPPNADVTSYGVVYSYALSKRTDINAVLAHFDNKNLAQAAPGQAGFFGGFTKSAGTDANNVALGIRHRF
jgi:predicted porin